MLDEFGHDGETAGDDTDCKLGRAPQTQPTKPITFIRGFDEAPSGVSAQNGR